MLAVGNYPGRHHGLDSRKALAVAAGCLPFHSNGACKLAALNLNTAPLTAAPAAELERHRDSHAAWQRRSDRRLPPLNRLYPSRISTDCRRRGSRLVQCPLHGRTRQQTRHTGKGLLVRSSCKWRLPISRAPRPWPPCRSPGPRFLFSRPTCSLSLRQPVSPCESGLRLALTSDSESGCHSQAQAGSARSGRQNRTRSRSLQPASAVTLPNRTTPPWVRTCT